MMMVMRVMLPLLGTWILTSTSTILIETTETISIFIMVFTKAGEQEGWELLHDGIPNLLNLFVKKISLN